MLYKNIDNIIIRIFRTRVNDNFDFDEQIKTVVSWDVNSAVSWTSTDVSK
jgi:hypothetical protein